jgi:hypothetical protein
MTYDRVAGIAYLFSVAVLYTISLTPRFSEVHGRCLLPQPL